jgi:putative ABC transport system permease protein
MTAEEKLIYHLIRWGYHHKSTYMFKNYFKIAWRNILRNKTNSIINVAGLGIGIAGVILITLYIRDEKSYDGFFKNADHIFQVDMDVAMGGQAGYVSNTPPTVGPALQQSFPEVKAYTRFYVMGNEIISNGEDAKEQKHFTEKKLLAVDSNFLQVFDYSIKEGNPQTCLQQPHSIVLTETTAKKYFGTTEGIGKNLVLDEYHEPFTVTAILKDIPSQSTIQFDLLIPTAACPPVQHFSWSWVWLQMNTYILLDKNFSTDSKSIKNLENKFPAMVKTQAANAFRRIGQPFDEFIKKGGKWDVHLQSLKRVHLYSADISSPFLSTLGDIKYIYIFSAIALFIILLACVNFMNLSTAQSTLRAKEVGIRKVLGSLRGQLVKQFLTEAMLYSFISSAIALILVALLLPLFNSVAGKTLSFNAVFHSGIWLFILLLTVVTGLFAGSYPAFYLTSFNPTAVLKGGVFKKSWSNIFIRNGLVVFQFTVSVALIICTIIVFQQLQFTQTKDIGLKKDNVIILPNGAKMENNTEETFRQEIAIIPGITHASISTSIPTRQVFDDSYVPDITGVEEPLAKDIVLSSFMVDEEFIPALQIKLLKGRNFSKYFNDSTSVIVNETAVKQIGWRDPLDKYITYPGNRNQHFKIIGVVKDFDVASLRAGDTIVPFALFHSSSKTYQIGTSYIIASVQSGNIKRVLNQLEGKWKSFAPSVPFEYSFLDKNFEALYNSEQRMGDVFGIFTCLSIIVACLGLFGLSVYTAERRTREIGIRKVLGATVQSIVSMISKEFVKLVFVAAIVAFPLAWWAMNKWLQNFAYRVTIEWWVFIGAGILACTIALLTISFQSIKAASANPVKSLRTE